MKKTSIPPAWVDIDHDDTNLVQAAIPQDVYLRNFKQRFIKQGAQDRIIGNLVKIFIRLCDEEKVPKTYSVNNENKAIKILDKLGRLG